MRVLCLTDFQIAPGYNWLWHYLPPGLDEVDFCWLRAPADRFAKWGKLLAYYPTYGRLAWRALAQTKAVSYDVAAAWEGKNGLPYAFLRRLAGRDRPPLVILFFSVKGIAMHLLPLVRYAMRGAIHIVVPSWGEVDYYQRLLGIPAGRVTFSPLGSYDLFAGQQHSSGEYIFAGGRSERDYRTFFHAVTDLPIQVVVNARRFNVAGLSTPANVTVNDLMPLNQLQKILAAAKFVVVPLQDVPHAAGLSQIILAMSAGKTVVATRSGGATDYIEEGRTGLLVEPGNVAALRQAIQELVARPKQAQEMGRQARQRYEQLHTFPAMACRVRQILERVASDSVDRE